MIRIFQQPLLILLCAFAMVLQVVHADDGDAAVSLNFKTLLFAAGTQQSAQATDNKAIAPELPDYYYFNGKNYESVSYSHSGLSDTYAYRGALEMGFFTRVMGADGQWLYQPAFSVQLAPSWTDVMIILLPGAEENKLIAYAVNTSSASFESGTIQVLNLSQRDVVLNVADKVYPLYPLDPVEVDISKIENNILSVALALKEDSEFKLVYKRKWSMRPTVRGVYFLFTLNGDYRRWYMKNIIL